MLPRYIFRTGRFFLQHDSTTIPWLRSFASFGRSQGGSDRDCWNCLKRVSCQKFFCDCGKLQYLNPQWNLFDVLSVPEVRMDLDIEDLAKRKRSLQKAFHPDRFMRSTEKEQMIAASVSAQINDAYKVLSDPITRAEYILTLNGSPCSAEDAHITDQNFLMEVMELNEQLEYLTDDSTSAKRDELVNDLERLYAHIIRRREEELKAVSEAIGCSNWKEAHEVLSKVRYFERLRTKLRSNKPKLAIRGVNISVE